MAGAVSKEKIAAYQEMFHHDGMKLVMAAPARWHLSVCCGPSRIHTGMGMWPWWILVIPIRVLICTYEATRTIDTCVAVIAGAVGDILCHGGAPGHAVLIVDEAVNEAGERCFLLAQGFIPAQSCQILAGYAGAESPWYSASQLTGDEIRLEGYTFRGDGILRRWNGGFS